MKHIQKFIIEKFKINSKNIEITKQNQKKNEIIKWSKKLKIPYNECEDLCNKYWFVNASKFFNIDESYCSPLEALILLAAMLLDDYYSAGRYEELGMMDYKGRNNPYDFSWFEINTKDGDFLDTIKKWIKDNYKEFEKIFKIVEHSKLRPDDIFDIYFDICEN